jgi:Zn-dependent metalloprotease
MVHGQNIDSWMTWLGRRGWNDATAPLHLVVGDPRYSAEWADGRIVVGNMDGASTALSGEMLTHEVVHGFNAAEGYGQPKGHYRNESWADVLAVTAPHSNGNWRLGDDRLVAGTRLRAVRDLANPTFPSVEAILEDHAAWRSSHPDWPNEFWYEYNQHRHGGPFSLAAVRAAEATDREAIHRTWYEALRLAPQYVRPYAANAQNSLSAGATIEAAKRIAPGRPELASSIEDAWRSVGIEPLLH